jgi:Asp-tRNA(Asn)/Glu-tRNA(Gln) amidotransferase A subunit family amidase
MQMDYQQRFAQALDRDGIDVILCPACPLPAFTHGASNDLGTAPSYITCSVILLALCRLREFALRKK